MPPSLVCADTRSNKAQLQIAPAYNRTNADENGNENVDYKLISTANTMLL